MELKEIIKDAVVISENATFAEALNSMLTQQTNTLLVVDDEGVLSGEIDVSDLFDGIIPVSFNGDQAMAHLENETAFQKSVREAADTPVFEFMNADYKAIYPTDSLMDVASIAVTHGRARIPVVDHEQHPIGIISRQGLKQLLGKYLKQH